MRWLFLTLLVCTSASSWILLREWTYHRGVILGDTPERYIRQNRLIPPRSGILWARLPESGRYLDPLRPWRHAEVDVEIGVSLPLDWCENDGRALRTTLLHELLHAMVSFPLQVFGGRSLLYLTLMDDHMHLKMDPRPFRSAVYLKVSTSEESECT